MSRLLIKKDGRAKYISHLDLMRTMQRVMLRAGLRLKHTEGFNPHPYMSFALPLSVGTESVCELMDFKLLDDTDIKALPELITKCAPEGITVLEAYESDRKFRDIKWLKIAGTLFYDNAPAKDSVKKLNALFDTDELVAEKKTKRGSAEVNIIPLINQISFAENGDNEIAFTAVLAAQEPSLPPAQLVSAIEQKLPELKPDHCSFKRLEIFDGSFNIFR